MFAVLQDPTSLNNLHDLVVPEPISYWPPSPGWYALIGAFLLLAICVAVKWIRYRMANAYRQAALKELAELRSYADDSGQRTLVISRVNELLKRVALACWKRPDVASRSGNDWLEFINATGKKDVFTDDEIKLLTDVSYSSRLRESLTNEKLAEVMNKADQWIREHRMVEFDAEPIEQKQQVGS